jgi:hypothetical protein
VKVRVFGLVGPCYTAGMNAPLRPILDRLFDPVSRCLTPEAAAALLALRLDPDVQTRLDELANKSTEGELTEAEREEYAAYVSALDLIGILQSQARARLAADRVGS